MQVDLHRELASAIDSVASEIASLSADGRSGISAIGLRITDPLSGQSKLAVAAEVAPWTPQPLRIISLADFSLPPRTVARLDDYWFADLEADADGRVWIEVVNASGETTQIDLEADEELASALLDFLEAIVNSDSVHAAMTQNHHIHDDAHVVLQFHDGAYQKVFPISR